MLVMFHFKDSRPTDELRLIVNDVIRFWILPGGHWFGEAGATLAASEKP